jgi:CubicO group peptidase (beta-lactamase class C family)
VDALELVDAWDVPNVAAAVVRPEDVVSERGDPAREFRWASVTKLLTSYAVLVAAEEGILELDEPSGPPGSTVRHLLAHASGLPFEGDAPIAAPASRRIYSNPGYDLLGGLLAERAGMPFADYLDGAVLAAAGLCETRLLDRPSQGLHGPLRDLVAFAAELLRPRIVAPETYAEATAVAFPGLAGVLPGIGRFALSDWGLGPELRGDKSPHWTGTRNSTATFGHFGGAGTFLWVDPRADAALICLTDREFGPWALQVWPALADAVLAGLSP